MDDSDGTAGPRVMMYSQDSFGLGHMRRVSSIAHRLLSTCPEARVVTLGDSSLGHCFAMAPNQRYIQLPPVVRDGSASWRAVDTADTIEHVHAMRTELIRDAALRFRPGVVLVDHMAVGVRGELLPTLEALRASGAATRIVLGLRDIVDAPARVRRRWQAEGDYGAIERFYDRVLVYGERDVFDLATQYALSPTIASRLRYCGYVCTPDLPQHSSQARARCLSGTAPDTRLITVMAGGGADSYPMMRACLDALPAIQAQQPAVMMLHTGPFMPTELRRELQREVRSLCGVSVSVGVSDTLSSMHAADLVVAMCGYNTTMELLRSGRPAILIPRAGPSAEQRTRAGLFAERGWVQMLDPDTMDVAALADMAIASLREAPPSRCPLPTMEGLAAVVDDLLSTMPQGASSPGARRG